MKNCTHVSETHIMLIGGRLDNACNLNQGKCTFNNAPMYFSLNPTLAPLPSCLNGTKTPVDCEERIDPALIMTHGMVQSGFIGCNTGNEKKLSSSQAQLGLGTCLADA